MNRFVSCFVLADEDEDDGMSLRFQAVVSA